MLQVVGNHYLAPLLGLIRDFNSLCAGATHIHNNEQNLLSFSYWTVLMDQAPWLEYILLFSALVNIESQA